MGKGRSGLGVAAYRDRWTESNVLHNTPPPPDCLTRSVLWPTFWLPLGPDTPSRPQRFCADKDFWLPRVFCQKLELVRLAIIWWPVDHQQAHMFCTWCKRKYFSQQSVFVIQETSQKEKQSNLHYQFFCNRICENSLIICSYYELRILSTFKKFHLTLYTVLCCFLMSSPSGL